MGDLRFSRRSVLPGPSGRRLLIGLVITALAMVLSVLPASAESGGPATPSISGLDTNGYLVWSPPSVGDAALITGYRITADDGTDPVETYDVAAGATYFLLPALPVGPYTVSLYAESGSGESAPASVSYYSCAVPDSPTDVQVGQLPNGHFGIWWTPPIDWGGPGDSYSLTQAGTQQQIGKVQTADNNFFDVSDLSAGTYTFQLQAHNQAYWSPPITLTFTVPRPPRVPAAVSDIELTDSDNSTNVTWTDGDDGGGHTITYMNVDGSGSDDFDLSATSEIIRWPAGNTYEGMSLYPLPRPDGAHVLDLGVKNTRGPSPESFVTFMHGSGPVPFQQVSVSPLGLVSWGHPADVSSDNEPMTSQSVYIGGVLVASGLAPSVRTYQLTSLPLADIVEVSAVGPDGESFSPPAPFTLTFATSISATVTRPLRDGELDLQWEANGFATSYEAWVQPSSEDGYWVTVPFGQTSLALKGLPGDGLVRIEFDGVADRNELFLSLSGTPWAAVPTSLTDVPRRPATSGATTRATIALKRGPASGSLPLASARVSLWEAEGGKWRFVRHLRTDASGFTSFGRSWNPAVRYRVSFAKQSVRGVGYAASTLEVPQP
jgi:Fibronectin type III domain